MSITHNDLVDLHRSVASAYKPTEVWQIHPLLSRDRRIMRRIARKTGVGFSVLNAGGRKLYQWPRGVVGA